MAKEDPTWWGVALDGCGVTDQPLDLKAMRAQAQQAKDRTAKTAWLRDVLGASMVSVEGADDQPKAEDRAQSDQ